MAELTLAEIGTGFAVGVLGWLFGITRNRTLLLFIARRFFGDPARAMKEERDGESGTPLATLIAQQGEALRHLNRLIERMQEALDRNAQEHTHLTEQLGHVEGRVDELERDCGEVIPRVAALERRMANIEEASGLTTRATDAPRAGA